MLALSNKKSTFVLVSGCFGCCVLTILPKKLLFSLFLFPLILDYRKNWLFGKFMRTEVATVHYFARNKNFSVK